MDKPLVGLGADAAGFWLKEAVREHLASRFELFDFGVGSDRDTTSYANVGLEVGESVSAGRFQRAILICGTGIGMAISANKVPSVRATVAYDYYSVERSVLSNNCQVLALGSRVIATELALRICDHWLSLCFDPESPSAKNLEVLARYEARPLGGAGLATSAVGRAEAPEDTLAPVGPA